MTLSDDLRRFAVQSALTSQALIAFEAELPRYIDRLQDLGVEHIPPLGTRRLTLDEIRVQNHATLLLVQEAEKRNTGPAARQHGERAHDTRNLLPDVRPRKL